VKGAGSGLQRLEFALSAYNFLSVGTRLNIVCLGRIYSSLQNPLSAKAGFLTRKGSVPIIECKHWFSLALVCRENTLAQL